MSGFIPIYNRSSDSLNQMRLTATLQANQARLQKLQQQIATGNRLHRPSDDPKAALRAIGYQAAIERSSQYARNLDATRSFLSATDTQLRNANQLLTELHGNVVSWADGSLTAIERQAAIMQLSGHRDRLLAIGNAQYQGRYLFSGSNPGQVPYLLRDGQVVFQGNDGSLKSPSADDILLQSNITAQTAFGGNSQVVFGKALPGPPLTAATRLSDLRGGQGVNLGVLEVSAGGQPVLVDLTHAKTVGDVVQALEAQAPAGRHLKVDMIGQRLEVRLADAGMPVLQIQDAHGGTMAADLGIRTGIGQSLPGQIVGQALAPRLTTTTPLTDLSGSPAVAYLSSPGSNNDIVFRARSLGPQDNGLTIQYVDSDQLQAGPGVMQGSEQVHFLDVPRAAQAGLAFSGLGNDLRLTATQAGSQLNQVRIQITTAGSLGNNAVVQFNANDRILSIGIDQAGQTTAQAVIDAIAAEGTFQATPDETRPENGPFNPNATISASDAGVVTGHTGNSGGDANTVYIHVNPQSTKAWHVVAALNKNQALIDRFDIGLDPLDGPTLSVPGLNTIDPDAKVVTKGGSGEDLDVASGFQIEVDGVSRTISLQGLNTVQDLTNAINASGTGAFAEINQAGNGIVVALRQVGVQFSIGENGGQTATQLGIRTLTHQTALSSLNFGAGVSTQPGTDFTVQRGDGSSFAIDLSLAQTIGDVLNRINDHPDNQDPSNRIVARLAATGNGIELLDDNPTGSLPLSIHRQFGSTAAYDLGLIPAGQEVGYPDDAHVSHAQLEIKFSDISGLHRSYQIRANLPGDQYNHIEVEIVAGASGDNAEASFDPLLGRIVIQVDPAATRTSTLVDAVQQTGLFRAELLPNSDGSFNNGSGIVTELGVLGSLAGGGGQPTAMPAVAVVHPDPPQHANTALTITAAAPGTAMNGYQIVFQSGAVGDMASATVDPVAKQLVLTIDPANTTSNTILAAIQAEGTFLAELNTDVDPDNDGSGVFGQLGSLGMTAGGAPGVFRSGDVNPQDNLINGQNNRNVFQTIDLLIRALSDESSAGAVQLAHATQRLNDDLDRLLRAMAEVGARHQYNEFLIEQNEDLTIDLRRQLSETVEVDMVEAISQLTAQQTLVEASLKMIAQTFRTSLLDFI